ncbi:MAG: restriction endonuclease subunit S, partial [Ruminococcus sp.]|nr:restriction endonuclease subunit S [Ruminococcus sp.]
MTAQQLRRSILQLAVQGKLVPQNPLDEPASVLLERIRKEKQELIRAGKIKKSKEPLPIKEEEIPFDIPNSWEWVRLGYISSYAHTKKKINASNADRSMWQLDLEDIEKGGKLLNKKTVGEINAKGDKTYFNKGDILYSKLRPYLLKILIAEDNGICTPEIIPFNLFGNILSEYIVLLLKSPYVDTFVNSKTYGVKMPRASTETMTSLLVPLPPLAEQHRIVAKIEELMPYIEQLEQAETQLTRLDTDFPEALKKSILQEAVQGRLVPQDPSDEPASLLLQCIRKEKQELISAGKIKKSKELLLIKEDEIPFEIPDSWEWVRLGNIVNIVSARRVHQSDWKKSGIPFYRAREISSLADNGYVNNELFITQELYDEFSKNGVPKENDLMITAVGTLGKTYVVKNTDKFYYKDASVISLENYGNINPYYLKIIFESPVLKQMIKKFSSGTTVGTITIVKAKD